MCFIALSLGVLCYKLYYYESQLSAALIVIALISAVLEIFLYRIIAWWIYVGIAKCYKAYKLGKRREEFERAQRKIVDISQNPEKYKELFKKYPRDFITADVRYKKPPETLNFDDIFYTADPETGEVRQRGPYDPATDLDREAAERRGLNRSGDEMGYAQFPNFNADLPQFNESDIDSMAELREFNRLLIDKMYTAYNEDADALLKQGNIKDIGTKGELLNKLEEGREKELMQARKNYKVAADVFGIIEESDEEEKQTLLMKDKKTKDIGSTLPDTYYRDIAQVKAKRELIKKAKKNKLNASADDSAKGQMKYTKKGVYALDQLKPLAKQPVYLQSEKKKPKPKVREIERKQIPIMAASPKALPASNSSEAIDEEHIKFQSAEKSAGTTTERERYRGITSIQEQPHKYSTNAKFNNHDKSPPRNITQDHFKALKSKFRSPDFGKI